MRTSKTATRRSPAAAQKTAPVEWIEPQLATLVNDVPAGNQWLHELKFDGYRLLCRSESGIVRLFTRNQQDWTTRFAAVARAAKTLDARQALLDGEVVALEDDGTHSFQRLQNSLTENDSTRLVYYVFDLLYLDGRDLRGLPLIERKELLRKLVAAAPAKNGSAILRYSEHWIGQGEALLRESCSAGLEGILSKRCDDPYRSGRSRSWLKIKCAKSQEFVIAGYTDPAGARIGFGALLLGVHEGGKLRYAGKVGTGFNDASLRNLLTRLEKIRRNTPPFSNALRGAALRRAHWVEPQLACEVTFTGWTSDGLLRHPSFKGLREDKAPGEITREVAQSASTTSRMRNMDDRVSGIRLTHPDRVLYPEQGITKREIALYYEKIGELMLPHLAGRPLTVVRCPEGRAGQCFYQRHARQGITEPVRSIAVREAGRTARYLAVDSVAGLIALAQMGILEIHTWGSRQPKLERPDRLTFDLDPGEGVSWQEIVAAALRLRAGLEELGLTGFVKTTGGKGLHVVTPIVAAQSWDAVKRFARSLAESVATAEPARYITNAAKDKRGGKVFIDYLRNSRSATAVCAYSTRARPGATVSMPISWQDLQDDVRESFTVRTVPSIAEHRRIDPWQGYENVRRALPKKAFDRKR